MKIKTPKLYAVFYKNRNRWIGPYGGDFGSSKEEAEEYAMSLKRGDFLGIPVLKKKTAIFEVKYKKVSN